LQNAESENEKYEKADFKIVHTGGAADVRGSADFAGEVKERADHQQDPAEDAPAFEADEVPFLDQAVEFNQAGNCKKQNQQHENVIGYDAITGEQGQEDDCPERDSASEAPDENFGLGGRGWS